MFTTAALFTFGALCGVMFTHTTNHRSTTIMQSAKNRLFGTRRRRVASITGALVLTAGIALAAWLINAEGPGSGRVASLVAPTVAAGAPATSGGMLPGGTGDARFSVQNPNSVDLVVTAIREDTGQSGATNWTPDPGTTPPSNTVTVPTQSGLSIPVPANATTPITVPNGYRLSSSAPTTIQGATFTKRAELTFSTP